MDVAENTAVYEFIDGKKLSGNEVEFEHIGQCAQFLTRLDGLKTKPGAKEFPLASEARFSVAGIVENVEFRIERLSSVRFHSALNLFLDQDLKPLFQELKRWSQSKHGEEFFRREIEWSERILSPSDFGFHNALLRQSSELVFLDFEYFGWCDPAKMLSDFILHPAFSLKKEFCSFFVEKMLFGLKENPGLSKRLEVVYPLFGIKWCLILLNEFLPDQFQRRAFAFSNPDNVDKIQIEQLEKAKRMFEKIGNEYEHFPY